MRREQRRVGRELRQRVAGARDAHAALRQLVERQLRPALAGPRRRQHHHVLPVLRPPVDDVWLLSLIEMQQDRQRGERNRN